MRDIVEVSKVNKDEDWMDSLLIKLLYFFHLVWFLHVLVRCEKKGKSVVDVFQ